MFRITFLSGLCRDAGTCSHVTVGFISGHIPWDPMGSHCSVMHPTPGVPGEMLEHYSSCQSLLPCLCSPECLLQLPCTLGHLPGKTERPSDWLPPHAIPLLPNFLPFPFLLRSKCFLQSLSSARLGAENPFCPASLSASASSPGPSL